MNTALQVALILAASAVVLVSLAALYRSGSDRSKRWLTGMPVDYTAEVRAFFAKHRAKEAEVRAQIKRGRHRRNPADRIHVLSDGRTISMIIRDDWQQSHAAPEEATDVDDRESMDAS